MLNAFLDKNGQQCPIAYLGNSKDITTAGEVLEAKGIVRIKALEDSRIRIFGLADDGVLLSADETEYFNIPEDKSLELVSGSINLMY